MWEGEKGKETISPQKRKYGRIWSKMKKMDNRNQTPRKQR
jgi:hypothetical protein